jgi:glucokinase
MTKNKNSAMWNVGDLNAVTGKTAFDYYHSDAAAKKVVDDYLEDLSIGVINVANAFRPQVIIIGGGISAQKDIIIPVLQKAVDENSYGGRHGLKFRIVSAKAGNKAGILGAATLVAANLTK